MTQEHPITPPPDLVQQWESTAYDAAPVSYTHHIARCAARWGADQALAKSPSLKEQAIEILDDIDTQLDAVHYNILRRALETLSD